MSTSPELTYSEVAKHNTKNDLQVVIHDKVYNVGSFVDEHPGGEEVLLDVGGQDATEAFEDVGHSDEAREILSKMLVGELKRQPGDPSPKTHSATATAKPPPSAGGLGIGLYAFLILGGAAAYFAYQFLQGQQSNKS
ncbi:cytochrome b5 [Piedraia hortae CBS 480.64]|uniref:Cytochrome b5 n=1 Tax=Piedraia hortae CBS 480.64 TaxID=1314780 RepID=A0A6A7C0T1_9PEZI|nr:cytochrome b5 [Piedraia hortae CBS 480.64]